MAPRHSIISRQDAHMQGLRRFYTGKQCERGHYSERYVSNGACVQCVTFKTDSLAPNMCYPKVALLSQVNPLPAPEEIEAAFKMIEAYGWLDHCILEIRKDPALLIKFSVPANITERAALAAQVDQAYSRALREYERLKAMQERELQIAQATADRAKE